MLKKTSSTTFTDYFRVMKGANPSETWVFSSGDLHGEVINAWRTGIRLIINGNVMAENDKMVALDASRPMLEATFTDAAGVAHQIEVYVRAVLAVKIRVVVDGVSLSDGLV